MKRVKYSLKKQIKIKLILKMNFFYLNNKIKFNNRKLYKKNMIKVNKCQIYKNN